MSSLLDGNDTRTMCPVYKFLKFHGTRGEMYWTEKTPNGDRVFPNLPVGTPMLLIGERKRIDGGDEESGYIKSTYFRDMNEHVVVRLGNRVLFNGFANDPNFKASYERYGGRFTSVVFFMAVVEGNLRLFALNLKGLALSSWFDFKNNNRFEEVTVVRYVKPTMKQGKIGKPSLVPNFELLTSKPKQETVSEMRKVALELKKWIDEKNESEKEFARNMNGGHNNGNNNGNNGYNGGRYMNNGYGNNNGNGGYNGGYNNNGYNNGGRGNYDGYDPNFGRPPMNNPQPQNQPRPQDVAVDIYANAGNDRRGLQQNLNNNNGGSDNWNEPVSTPPTDHQEPVTEPDDLPF